MRSRELTHAIDQARRAQIAQQGGYQAVERDAHDHDRFLTNHAKTRLELVEPPIVTPLRTLRKLTLAQLAQAQAMRAQGASYPRIALAFGVDHTTIMYWLDPRQRQTRQERYAARKREDRKSVV